MFLLDLILEVSHLLLECVLLPFELEDTLLNPARLCSGCGGELRPQLLKLLGSLLLISCQVRLCMALPQLLLLGFKALDLRVDLHLFFVIDGLGIDSAVEEGSELIRVVHVVYQHGEEGDLLLVSQP